MKTLKINTRQSSCTRGKLWSPLRGNGGSRAVACSFSSRPKTKASKTHVRPPLPAAFWIKHSGNRLCWKSQAGAFSCPLIHDSRPRHSGTNPPPRASRVLWLRTSPFAPPSRLSPKICNHDSPGIFKNVPRQPLSPSTSGFAPLLAAVLGRLPLGRLFADGGRERLLVVLRLHWDPTPTHRSLGHMPLRRWLTCLCFKKVTIRNREGIGAAGGA